MEDEQAMSYTRKLFDLLDEYEAAVRAARARKTPGSGLLGLGPKGSDDPCHEAFDSKLAALFAAMAAGDMSVGDAAEATGLLRRFQREHGGALGWVHGHNHCDQIDRGEGFPIVAIGCSKLESFPEYKPLGSVTPMRYPDEPRQELWDVLLIHARGDDFELIRYGAGADRHIKL